MIKSKEDPVKNCSSKVLLLTTNYLQNFERNLLLLRHQQKQVVCALSELDAVSVFAWLNGLNLRPTSKKCLLPVYSWIELSYSNNYFSRLNTQRSVFDLSASPIAFFFYFIFICYCLFRSILLLLLLLFTSRLNYFLLVINVELYMVKKLH